MYLMQAQEILDNVDCDSSFTKAKSLSKFLSKAERNAGRDKYFTLSPPAPS